MLRTLALIVAVSVQLTVSLTSEQESSIGFSLRDVSDTAYAVREFQEELLAKMKTNATNHLNAIIKNLEKIKKSSQEVDDFRTNAFSQLASSKSSLRNDVAGLELFVSDLNSRVNQVDDNEFKFYMIDDYALFIDAYDLHLTEEMLDISKNLTRFSEYTANFVKPFISGGENGVKEQLQNTIGQFKSMIEELNKKLITKQALLKSKSQLAMELLWSLQR